jgi:uncharacterized membrane protein (UPF0127 family)
MLIKPVMLSLGEGKFLWLALAMSSTLAGNFTLIGSVANLIVAQQARRTVNIGFMEYFRAGALITLITMVIGVLVLFAEVKLAHGSEAWAAEKAASPISATISRDHTTFVRSYQVVLLCDTESSRERGLQGFRPLSADESALFVFPKPEAVTFWMGSVAFPIDIVFISPDRRVVRVYPLCWPGSLEVYPSIQKISWVLETAAGSGIEVGDKVSLK